MVYLGINDLDKVKTKLKTLNKKPVNILLFAGFFIVIGLLLIGFGFYYIGKIEVAEGVVRDQMGRALVQKAKMVCDSDFTLENRAKSKKKQQRQMLALEMVFPQLLSKDPVKIQLCDDTEIIISDNYEEFQIILKRSGNYYLSSKGKSNSSNSSKNLGQIKHVSTNQ